MSSLKYDPEYFKKEIETLPGALGKNARQLRDAFAQAKKELDLTGLDKFEKVKIETRLREAASKDLADILMQERAQVQAQLDKERRTWERSLELNADKFANETRAYERRLAAMSAQELQAETQAFLGGEKVLDHPDKIDVLSVAIKGDGQLHKLVRETVNSQRLYDGWLHGDTGKDISRYLQAVDAALEDGNSIPVKGSDGQPASYITGDHLFGGEA